jgi:hypothetical protein
MNCCKDWSKNSWDTRKIALTTGLTNIWATRRIAVKTALTTTVPPEEML